MRDAQIKSVKGRPSWNKGIPMLPHVKEKLIQSVKGKPSWNKGIKGSVLGGMKGKKHTLESILKMKASLKGKIPWNKELKGKGVCKGFTGKHTQESIDKMSKAKIGKIVSKEHREKISESLKKTLSFKRLQSEVSKT